MAKDVGFTEYSAEYEDRDGDKHSSVVRAHQADRDTAKTLGTVSTRTGSHDVREGDVLVETDRPGVYDVHDRKTWDEIGYTKGTSAFTKGSSAPSVDNPTGTAQGESGTDEQTPKDNPPKPPKR